MKYIFLSTDQILRYRKISRVRKQLLSRKLFIRTKIYRIKYLLGSVNQIIWESRAGRRILTLILRSQNRSELFAGLQLSPSLSNKITKKTELSGPTKSFWSKQIWDQEKSSSGKVQIAEKVDCK